MSFTDTDICNQALDLLGKEPINSINDTGSKRAASCRQHYETTVKAILSRGKFSFANRVAALALVNETVPFNFTYKHALPNDPPYENLVELENYERDPFDYEIFGKFILSDNATINMKYTARVPEAEFSGTFVELLTYKLAAKMALRLTGLRSIRDQWEEEYRTSMKSALQADYMARSPKKIYRQLGRNAFTGTNNRRKLS